ncbi:MAG: hypothetical protein HW421_2882 [Ignavibacteria bacterium]|nr:hypothetical protein [Ignavibacteria bacterium]
MYPLVKLGLNLSEDINLENERTIFILLCHSELQNNEINKNMQ